MELRFAAARAAEDSEESAICLDPRTDIFLYAGDAWYLHGARSTPESLLAPHTSGPRDVPRCGALSLKDAALQGGPAETAVG
jgi:hypothetical protein